MNKQAKVYVAGHRGLVGSALIKALRARGYQQIITRTHAQLDLTDQAAVHAFMMQERPDYLFLAAAKVGGIIANNTYPAEFVYQNLTIEANVIHSAWQAGVKRLLFLGSSCIYPRDCPQPIREDYLLTGPLESTNRPYAIAKIAGIEMCWSYNRQYGTQYIAVMPTNLYGPGDNYHLENSHVIPAMIRKMHDAKQAKAEYVTLWGTGTPMREFLYSEDMAEACLHLMELNDAHFRDYFFSDTTPPLANIGCGQDLSIRDLARKIQDVVGFKGEIRWDATKPDGTPRKLLDSSRIRSTNWQPRISLDQGIALTYANFLAAVEFAK